MGGSHLDAAQVRKLEKLPTKKELITAIAVMIKKVRLMMNAKTTLQQILCGHSLGLSCGIESKWDARLTSCRAAGWWTQP